MSENEISRIVARLDNLEQRWNDKMEHHQDVLKEELDDFKSDIKDVIHNNNTSNRWLMGVLFGLAFSVIGYIAVSHFSLKHSVENQGDDLGTVIGIMGQKHPEYYILDELDQKYTPKRGGIQ